MFCNHRTHFDCITKWFDTNQSQNYFLRKCIVSRQPALPLMRDSWPMTHEESSLCETLIMYACRTGDLATLNKHLSINSSIAHERSDTNKNITLLHISAKNDHDNCLNVLLDNHFSVDSVMQDGCHVFVSLRPIWPILTVCKPC